MAKITIEKEIENFKNTLKTREDTWGDYLALEIKELQAIVLACHARLEGTLETIILSQIAKEIDEEDFKRSQILHLPTTVIPRSLFLNPTVFRLMDRISFREKLHIVKEFDDEIPASSLEKVNSYRNEFAHPKGANLGNKYNYNKKAGKIIVRDLLRCLVKAEKEMDAYILKSFPNIFPKKMSQK